MRCPPGAPAGVGTTAGFAIVDVMTPDLARLHAALERQIALLAPIAHRLRLAVVHPPIAPHDWRGPASRSYASLEEQLRSRIRDAEDAVAAALHHSRLAAGQVAAVPVTAVPVAAAQVSAAKLRGPGHG
jgi:hypothetical protein